MRDLFKCFTGDLGRVRTSDLKLRKLALYPAELRDHNSFGIIRNVSFFIKQVRLCYSMDNEQR